MKDESVQKCLDAQKAAIEQVYEDGKAEGASAVVPAQGFSQADLDALVQQVKDEAAQKEASLQGKLDQIKALLG